MDCRRYLYGKLNPLESAVAHLTKMANGLNLPVGAVHAVMQEVFAEMISGKKWPLDGCDPDICDCGITNTGTAIVHDMVRRIQQYHQELQRMQMDTLNQKFNATLAAYLSRKTLWQRTLGRDIPLPAQLKFIDRPVL